MHGRDDGGRGVEGVEGGALGAVVFLGREQRFQLLAEGLPAGVLVAAGDRVGEDRQGDRPEAGEAGERLLLLRRGGPLLLLDGLQGADGGEDVAGLGFLAAGDGSRGVLTGERRGSCGWYAYLRRDGPAMGPDGHENQPQAGCASVDGPAALGRPSGEPIVACRPGGLITCRRLGPGGAG